MNTNPGPSKIDEMQDAGGRRAQTYSKYGVAISWDPQRSSSRFLTVQERTTFGFWVYLMSDALIFAALFATYAVLHGNTFGGPSAHALFSLPFALAETLILLTSSFTVGLALLASERGFRRAALSWLIVTFLFGAAFLVLELSDFASLLAHGESWSRSGFLSSFFGLVGTHGLHVFAGLVWMLVLMVELAVAGQSERVRSRLARLALFWHFLDLVWIFIFAFVYLFAFI